MRDGQVLIVVQDGKPIDRVRVSMVRPPGDGAGTTVLAKSLDLEPGELKDFGQMENSFWKLLFQDPFQRGRCYNSRSPNLELIETTHT